MKNKNYILIFYLFCQFTFAGESEISIQQNISFIKEKYPKYYSNITTKFSDFEEDTFYEKKTFPFFSKNIIHIDTKKFNQKNIFYSLIHETFNHDTDKLISFIFFHELGHHALQKDNNNTLNNHLKNKHLTNKEKKEITINFTESFADVFAIQMMMSKYPEINYEKTKYLIGWIRNEISNPTHNTQKAIYNMKKNEPQKESILNTSLNAAKSIF